jgi:indolepyruvate ferredoxin oxidoreductase
MTIEGGTPKKTATLEIELGALPEPTIPAFDGTHNVIITGVGGTGVVTIGAILAMAAHLDGHGAGMMEMAGLAQKGGAVHVHCRLAEKPSDISAIRVALGETDCLIGGDLVVAGGSKTLSLTAKGRTAGVVDAHETITGDFTRNRDFRIPGDDLKDALRRKLGDQVAIFDATKLAERALGSSIFANMILTGAAWQAGLLPISRAAMRKAIELNGAGVEKNLHAFEIGRWATLNPQAVEQATAEIARLPKTLDERIRLRADHLRAYQGEALAQKYLALVNRATGEMKEAVALGYHKLLAYKDEYEVARLLVQARDKVAETYEGDYRLSHHLAPPLLPGRDPDGRPKKRAFGDALAKLFPWLAKGRVLRGTPLDLFGYTSERRTERRLIAEYEADLAMILADPDRNPAAAIARARLPLDIRGFGPVKEASVRLAETRRTDMMADWTSGAPAPRAAAE